MTNNPLQDIGTDMLVAISNKDAPKALAEILLFKDQMRNASVGAEYVMWVTEPVNLTKVHKALAEDLSIPPRLLAIRRSSMNRTQKAVLLMQAIELAVKRVHQI